MCEELFKLLTPPCLKPGKDSFVNDDIWTTVENHLGFRLPNDYKSFGSRYGPGGISYFDIQVPDSLDIFIKNLMYQIEIGEEHSEARGTEGLPDFLSSGLTFFPTLPGLFPFASTDDAQGCWWYVDTDVPAERWPIVVTPRHSSDDVYSFSMTFCEFFPALFLRRIHVPYLNVPDPSKDPPEFYPSGHPLHPTTLNPSWLTSTVLALAKGIHNEKAFDRMPILGDALQDAGCDNEEMLNHCRQTGEHGSGCWVVDLLLAKT